MVNGDRDYSSGASGGAPTKEMTPEIAKRLKALRKVLRAEDISMGELIELQGYAEYIEEDDVELLEAAGVPEFEDSEG